MDARATLARLVETIRAGRRRARRRARTNAARCSTATRPNCARIGDRGSGRSCAAPRPARARRALAAGRARPRRCCRRPCVSTTSPARSDRRRAPAGSSSSSSSSTARRDPRERIARHSDLPSAPAMRRFAGRVDVGRRTSASASREHLREIVEQVARARVAVRLEREHDAGGPASPGGRPRSSRRSRSGGGRSRRRASTRPGRRRDRRRATAAAARCPGSSASARWIAPSSISSSAATAMAASAVQHVVPSPAG